MKRFLLKLSLCSIAVHAVVAHAQVTAKTPSASNRPTAGANSGVQETTRSVPTSDLSMERIRSNAALIKDYIDLLAHPEQATRLAAFDELVNSKDSSVQEAAYAAGFASADIALRSLALKRRLLQARVLSIQLVPVKDVEGKLYVLALDIMGTNAQNGVLLADDNEKNQQGQRMLSPVAQIQGLDLSVSVGRGNFINVRQCRGKLSPVADFSVMKGTFECSIEQHRGPFFAELKIR